MLQIYLLSTCVSDGHLSALLSAMSLYTQHLHDLFSRSSNLWYTIDLAVLHHGTKLDGPQQTSRTMRGMVMMSLWAVQDEEPSGYRDLFSSTSLSHPS